MFSWLYKSKPKPAPKKRKKRRSSPVVARRSSGRVVLVPTIPVRPEDEADALKELELVRRKYALDV